MDFNTVRPIFGGKLAQSQVDGMNIILDAWRRYGSTAAVDINELAYLLATTKLETGATMQPIHERGPHAYFDKYEPGTKLGKLLGNTITGDGFLFRGRGDVQITGRANYAKASKKLGVDLVQNPDRALEPEIAARILIEGSREGWFTGKDLADYIDDIDESDDEDLKEYVQARRVINGQDKAEAIARDAVVFERALRASPIPVIPMPAPAPSGTKPRGIAVLIAVVLPILYGIAKALGIMP